MEKVSKDGNANNANNYNLLVTVKDGKSLAGLGTDLPDGAAELKVQFLKVKSCVNF